MSNNDESPRSPPSFGPLPEAPDPSSIAPQASSSRPRPTSSGQTYAQIVAAATRPFPAPDNWSVEDIDRADHLDSLSNYEGILRGHNWPIAPLPRPRRRELTGTEETQAISLDEILDNQLRTANGNASSSNIDIPSNPPLLPPPTRTARLPTDRWSSDNIAGDVRRIFGDTAQPYTSLRDRVDRFDSVLRESTHRPSNNGTESRPSAFRSVVNVPRPPTDQPIRRRRNPRILSTTTMAVDPDEPHPLSYNMDIDPSLSAVPPRGPDTDAPWRIVHMHPNRDLQTSAEDIEDEDEEDEDVYDQYSDLFHSQLAGEVAQLRRGGNNRHRARLRAERDERLREVLSDTRRISGVLGEMPRRAVTLYRPSRGGMDPTNGDSRAAETIRTDVARGVRSRSPSFSPSHPAKRRRITPSPNTPNSSRKLVRPSYLRYTTLPVDTPLPSTFIPPERHSHLALTTHRPAPSSASRSSALPSSAVPIPASSLPGSPSLSTAPPYRPLISFTVHPPPSSTDADACSLLTSHPIPLGVGVYYFEAEVIDSGKEGYMSIGFMKPGVNLGRLVGWEKGSWGWHADDGRAFEGSGVGKEFGPGWGVGDIVGAGVDYTTGRGFFTKNGKLIGHIFPNLPQGLHPAIGLRNPLESIAVNLTGPFMYDIDQHVKGIRDGIIKGLRDRTVKQVPRIIASAPKGDHGTKSDMTKGQIREIDPKSSVKPTTRSLESIDTDKEQASTMVVDIDMKSTTTVTAETALTDPVDKSITALVLDHLSHSGLETVKSLVLRDLSRRRLIQCPPSLSLPGNQEALQPMVRIIDICEKIGAGGRVPWNQLADLARPSESHREGGEADVVAEVDERSRRKLRILDLVAMLFLPGPTALTPSANGSLPTTSDTMGDTIMSEQAPVVIPTDNTAESDMEINESAISEGRRLLAASRSESWTSEERGWLMEAFGLISGVKQEAVWEERRRVWTRELKESLKCKQGIKATSYLQQAYAQTGRVMDLLIAKGDGGAAFVDPIAFVRDHGKKVGGEHVETA